MTIATDTFSGSGALTGQWTTAPSHVAPTQSGGTFRTGGVTTDSASYINSFTPGANQYAKVTVNTCVTATSRAVGATVRQDTSVDSRYQAMVRGPLGASATVELAKHVSGTFSVLATTTRTVNSGDVIECRAVGTTIMALLNGTVIHSVTDSALSGGRVGVHVYVDTGTTADALGDNFEGGDYAATSQYSDLSVARNRPGRAPFSKGTFRIKERSDSPPSGYALAVRVGSGGLLFGGGAQVVTLGATGLSDAGRFTPRPGRGPLNLGRYFVAERIDAIGYGQRFVVATGGLQLGGASAVAAVRLDAPSGGLVIAGTAPASAARIASPTGGLQIGGAAQTTVISGSQFSELGTWRPRPSRGPLSKGRFDIGTKIDAYAVGAFESVLATGGLQIGGSAAVLRSRVSVSAGGLIFAGASTRTLGRLVAAVGGMSLLGVGARAAVGDRAGAGGLVLSGAAILGTSGFGHARGASASAARIHATALARKIGGTALVGRWRTDT